MTHQLSFSCDEAEKDSNTPPLKTRGRREEEPKVRLAAANEICVNAVLVAPFIRTRWHFYTTARQVVVMCT